MTGPEATVGTMTPEPAPKSSIKETVTSITIAFVLAFVFRGFVMEAFQIPTGSMAPTLLGQHMRFTGPETGVSWAVGPRDFADPGSQQVALARQGSPGDPIRVTDPMLRPEGELVASGVPRRAGDRIFVLKYLYSVFDPSRFDVVVFKNPGNPQQNFIKRLIGLPGEQVALVAGDLFVRPASDALRDAPGDAAASWGGPTWRIQRKPERVQRAVWQTLFDSRYTPHSALAGRAPFRPPWVPSGPGWEMSGRAVYVYSGSEPSALTWDASRRPIDDYYAYNEVRPKGPFGPVPSEPRYPVPDVAVRFGLRSEGSPEFGVAVEATGHVFRARVLPDGTVRLGMTPLPRIEGEPVEERLIGEGRFERRPGRALDVEVWHADQALTVFIDGRRVARGEYDLTPSQRIAHATGSTLDELLEETRRTGVNQLANPARYRRTQVRLEFGGGPLSLDRVALQRDQYWSPIDRPGRYARATHPEAPCVLGPDHFFVCGDNSPASEDGRLWTRVDPWVARQIDPTVGVVARPLLIGKAFFVYWPSADWSRRLPVPDFGRMRWIW